MRLLIVEDYKKISDLIALYAKQDGHDVIQVFNAEDALEQLKHHIIDVILLDLMLPHIQGEELIKKVRTFASIYIMVISAKIDIEGRINAIELGADDYVTKPFSIEEVMAKLKNVEKRLHHIDHNIYSYQKGDLKINLVSREVYVDNKLINLTKDEYDLLIHLAKYANRSFTRDELINRVLPHSQAYDRVIDTHIKNIRQKIDVHPLCDSYIKTHYGIGYQFVGKKDE